MSTDSLLPALIQEMRQSAFRSAGASPDAAPLQENEASVFKNMLQ
jgi:hypothetical protein